MHPSQGSSPRCHKANSRWIGSAQIPEKCNMFIPCLPSSRPPFLPALAPCPCLSSALPTKLQCFHFELCKERPKMKMLRPSGQLQPSPKLLASSSHVKIAIFVRAAQCSTESLKCNQVHTKHSICRSHFSACGRIPKLSPSCCRQPPRQTPLWPPLRSSTNFQLFTLEICKLRGPGESCTEVVQNMF